MRNFLRALRFAWPYRYRVLVSVACAVLAAVFWSLNFTAIYPVLKIIGSGDNLQTWIENTITKTAALIEPSQKKIADLNQEEIKVKLMPPGEARDTLLRKKTAELAQEESKLESARTALYWYQVLKRYIDKIFPIDRFNTLAMVIGLVVLGVAIKGFFEFWQESLVGNVVNLSLYDIRNRFYRKALHLDVNNFSQNGTHELMARFTNDTELLGTGIKTLLGKVVAEPLRALGCVAIACWISWQLTLMFLVLVPFALYILTRVGRSMKRATRRLLERMSTIYKILQESFVGIRIVKAFTNEANERRRFQSATKEYYNKAMLVVNLDALAGPVIEVLGVAAVAGALLVGAHLVLGGGGGTHLGPIRLTDTPLEAESLLQLYALLAAIADPVRKLSSVFTRIQSGFAAADRIFQYLDQQPKVRQNNTGPVLRRHQESIEFRDVCFSYDPGHPILTGIDLTVRHGETIALVGKNGCGKSTMLGLLPRFYDPDHGSVLIDGIDLRVANLRSLRQQVALVTQDTVLFDQTIFNNIAYGNKWSVPEDVERAARQAHAHDIITKLPQGYQTMAGEAGVKLSGGQKQRIAMARALLRDPSILILDEFTSQADAEAEMEVHRILREFMRGRTTFVITHRLNTLEIADRIVVLDAGRIVAVGTHAELLQSCGVYQRLHEAQFQRLAA
ncbi:MAG: ABC transporter ATP-binding protein [Planctomycetes bacterium]|nr:ABC transporter ATP-binding protein [Planctomycetota bacterium]